MRLPGTQPTVNEPVIPQTDTPAKPIIVIDPIQLAFLVFNKWPIIVLTAIIFTFIAYLYAKSADYIYRAGARVEVFHENRLRGASSETDYDRLERSASRHIIIMSGEMFHRELVAKLRVKWAEQMTQDELEVPFQIKAVRGSGVKFAPTMIDIFVDSKSPEYALDYLQGVLGAYRSYRTRELGQINKDALIGLRNEEKRIQSELTSIRSEIAQFEFENKVLVAKEREQMQDEVLNDLIGRLQVIQTERLLLEYQYKEIANADLTTISETLNVNQHPQINEFVFSKENFQVSNQNPPVTEFASITNNQQTTTSWKELEDFLLLLENKYTEQLKVFQIKHPKMKGLKAEIDTLKSSLERQLEVSLNRFQASYEALKRKEEAVETVIENMQNKKMLSPERESEYLRLTNHEAQMQSKYELVYQRLLTSAGAIDGFSFITIQEPYLFEDPISPNKLMLLAIGPFIGLTIGVVFILFKGFFIPTIYPILKEYRAKYKES
jgi:hypothetical protein